MIVSGKSLLYLCATITGNAPSVVVGHKTRFNFYPESILCCLAVMLSVVNTYMD
jgi:hypothetical protein